MVSHFQITWKPFSYVTETDVTGNYNCRRANTNWFRRRSIKMMLIIRGKGGAGDAKFVENTPETNCTAEAYVMGELPVETTALHLEGRAFVWLLFEQFQSCAFEITRLVIVLWMFSRLAPDDRHAERHQSVGHRTGGGPSTPDNPPVHRSLSQSISRADALLHAGRRRPIVGLDAPTAGRRVSVLHSFSDTFGCYSGATTWSNRRPPHMVDVTTGAILYPRLIPSVNNRLRSVGDQVDPYRSYVKPERRSRTDRCTGGRMDGRMDSLWERLNWVGVGCDVTWIVSPGLGRQMDSASAIRWRSTSVSIMQAIILRTVAVRILEPWVNFRSAGRPSAGHTCIHRIMR